MTTTPNGNTDSIYTPSKRVFGVSASPRKGGNSDVLLKGVKQDETLSRATKLGNQLAKSL